jgi:hypothetical protein
MPHTPLKPQEQQTGFIEAPQKPRILMTGSFDEIQKYFHAHGLSDGLPIVPPTEERVAAMLRHEPQTGRCGCEILNAGRSGSHRGESCDQRVMAGCEPRHMPVLLLLWRPTICTIEPTLLYAPQMRSLLCRL